VKEAHGFVGLPPPPLAMLEWLINPPLLDDENPQDQAAAASRVTVLIQVKKCIDPEPASAFHHQASARALV